MPLPTFKNARHFRIPTFGAFMEATDYNFINLINIIYLVSEGEL